MKLKEFARKVQEAARKYPNALVIYSSDEEGNSFHGVYNDPTAGYVIKQGYEYEFVDIGQFGDEGISEDKVNAVCIN